MTSRFMQPEPLIAFLPGSSATLSRLRLIAPEGCRVVPFANDVRLFEALSQGLIMLTVVEAGGHAHASAIRVLRRTSEAFPHHPLLAWCDFPRLTTGQLLEVARAGVQEIVRQGSDEGRVAFARIMAAATQRGAVPRIVEAVKDVIPLRFMPLLEFGLEHANERLDRDEVAAVFGIARRTLQDRLMAAELPSPRRFLMWCRLLAAAALLEQPGHTLDSVAGQLGFTDGPNLGNRLRQYTGHGSKHLRANGALDSMIFAFKSAILASKRDASVGTALLG